MKTFDRQQIVTELKVCGCDKTTGQECVGSFSRVAEKMSMLLQEGVCGQHFVELVNCIPMSL